VKINYRNFKKRITFRDSIEVNPVIIDTRNSSKKSVIDKDTGEVTEFELNEQKDEKVNYIYGGSNVKSYYRRGEPLSFDVLSKHIVDGKEYGVINYNDDQCGSPTDKDATLSIYVNNSGKIYNPEDNDKISQFSEYSVNIVPMHNKLKEDYILPINDNTLFNSPNNKDIIVPIGNENLLDIASSGIVSINFNLDSAKSFANKNKTKFSPISKSQFDKNIQDLSNQLKNSKMSVSVTRYTKKLDNDDIDINESFISRKHVNRNNGIKENVMRDAFDSFLSKHDELNPPDIDSISPFNVNVKEVSRSYMNESPDQLMEDLIQNVDAILDINGQSYNIDIKKGINVNTLYDKVNVEPDLTKIFQIPQYNRLKDRINQIISKMDWYEYFIGVPINFKYQRYGDASTSEPMTSFLTGELLYNGDEDSDRFYSHRRLARYLIPVDYGIRKVRKPGLFFFPQYEYIDDGIRWVLVEFYNSSVYEQFRQNTKPSGNSVNETDENGCPINEDLPQAIASDNDLTEDVVITFDMPHLPYDSELKKMAFTEYGYFDQSEYAIREAIVEGNANINLNNWLSNGSITIDDKSVSEKNATPVPNKVNLDDIPSGYSIFPIDSNKISDLRNVYGIHDKAQFLLNVLKNEFGSNNVKVTSTLRSSETQNKKQLGGINSNMLSWHNYGLAIKIAILGSDGLTLITESSEEYPKLYEIARNFTSACKNGMIGEPCNLVWCGQLKTGADIFDWEFLPIGIDHKDIHIFRDSAFNQKDAILDNLYVNADNYVTETKPMDKSPYILKNSNLYKNAIVYNNTKYVKYSKIRNINNPNNIILKDLEEFIFLIKSKKGANGESLTGITLKSWKNANPISFKQLVLYNSLIGNYEFVRSLISIDYIDEYSQYMLSGNVTNVDEFLINVMGNYSYNKINIKLSSQNDGKYISLSDGKVRIPSKSVKSNHPAGNGNTFGEKQIDENNYKYIENDELVSEQSIISDDQIEYIKGKIKDSIINEFNTIKELYESVTSNIMYDHYLDGNNKDDINLLENEFGIISTQDVLPFEILDTLYKKKPSNEVDYNGNIRDSRGEVFEKMISNAQVNGIQVAKIGKEKPVIEEVNTLSKTEAIKKLFSNGSIDAKDIL
jgi:hypothetical protein